MLPIRSYQYEAENILDEKPFEEGAIYYIADTCRVFMDPIGGNERICLTSDPILILDDWGPESIISPIPGKIYYSKTIKTGYIFIDGKWYQLNANPGDLGYITVDELQEEYLTATQSNNGTLSTTDKIKLDGIAAGANKYTHPTSSGNKHIPSGGGSDKILCWKSDGTAFWSYISSTIYEYTDGAYIYSDNVTSASSFKIVHSATTGIVFFTGYFVTAKAFTSRTVYDICSISDIELGPGRIIALSSYAPYQSSAQCTSGGVIKFRPYNDLVSGAAIYITGMWIC